MDNTANKKTLTKADLRHFTGSDRLYEHFPNNDVTYTEGADFVAERAKAYWLLDEIALAQRNEKAVSDKMFQIWKLTVNEDRTALLSVDDGNGNTVFSKKLHFTDFPIDEFSFWVYHKTIMLPSEY
jgi:hypothetical protein